MSVFETEREELVESAWTDPFRAGAEAWTAVAGEGESENFAEPEFFDAFGYEGGSEAAEAYAFEGFSEPEYFNEAEFEEAFEHQVAPPAAACGDSTFRNMSWAHPTNPGETPGGRVSARPAALQEVTTVVLEDFNRGDYRLKRDHRAQLEQLSASIAENIRRRRYASVRIELTGHATRNDATGNNAMLSLHRGANVKSALLCMTAARGVPASALEIKITPAGDSASQVHWSLGNNGDVAVLRAVEVSVVAGLRRPIEIRPRRPIEIREAAFEDFGEPEFEDEFESESESEFEQEQPIRMAVREAFAFEEELTAESCPDVTFRGKAWPHGSNRADTPAGEAEALDADIVEFMKFELRDFATSNYRLRPEHRKMLDLIAAAIGDGLKSGRWKPEINIEVRGYSSAPGDKRFNAELSIHRAFNAVNALKCALKTYSVDEKAVSFAVGPKGDGQATALQIAAVEGQPDKNWRSVAVEVRAPIASHVTRPDMAGRSRLVGARGRPVAFRRPAAVRSATR